MSRTHGLCLLMPSHTKECNEISVPKGVLLRVVVVWDAITHFTSRHLEVVLMCPYRKCMNVPLCEVSEVI